MVVPVNYGLEACICMAQLYISPTFANHPNGFRGRQSEFELAPNGWGFDDSSELIKLCVQNYSIKEA